MSACPPSPDTTVLDRITIFQRDRRTDLGGGRLKLGPDYACIHVPESAETLLPDRDVRGDSIVASGDGDVRYAGEIVGTSTHDTARRSRTTFRCKPARPPDG